MHTNEDSILIAKVWNKFDTSMQCQMKNYSGCQHLTLGLQAFMESDLFYLLITSGRSTVWLRTELIANKAPYCHMGQAAVGCLRSLFLDIMLSEWWTNIYNSVALHIDPWRTWFSCKRSPCSRGVLWWSIMKWSCVLCGGIQPWQCHQICDLS
jgi:hypothetical protein